MLDVRNLTIYIEDRKLIDNLSFSIDDGDKLAIIGEEGNGKSTIAKAIACPSQISTYTHVSGQINIGNKTIGYLEQILNPKWYNQEIYKYFLKEEPDQDDDYENYERFGDISRILNSFGLDSGILEGEQKIGELSGGEKVKLQLTKLMLKNPDILILDEPTNDLDIETLEWLEDFINKFKKPIIYISHDEELLEKTANAILHVEQLKKKTQNKTTFARMKYREYVDRRLHDIQKQTQVALNERAQDEIQMEKWRQVYNRVDHELNTISRKDPHGARLLKKKMQSVKSQEKRFERERKEFTEIPDTEESIFLNFGEGYIPNGKTVCDINFDKIEVQGKTLAKNINLKVVGPERIIIVGHNGVGKTTFIKKLNEQLMNREDIRTGYMPQNYEDLLKNYDTVLDYVAENVYEKDDITKIRTYLACLKFTKEEVMGNIKDLSGGQKAKLFIAKLMMDECDVLILDEPTRNLSPLSNPVIRNALNSFDGAIISISHDRKFIKEIGSKVYELTQTGFIDISDKYLVNQDEGLRGK